MMGRAAGLVCVCAVIAVAVIPPAGATADPFPIPVTVTFSATGTATVDQHYSGNGGSCTTHDVMTLTWVASFDTVIKDGELQGTPMGTLAAVGPGNLALTEGGICAFSPVGGSCSAGLSTGVGTPALTVIGSDPARVQAQSLPGAVSFSGCGAAAQAPFAGSDISVLDASLPGSATGVATIRSGSFASTDTYTTPVSSADAPDQIASSCLGVGRHGSGNDSCSASMTWHGTVTVAPKKCGGPKVKTVVAKNTTTGESREIPRAGWNAYGITSDEIQPGEVIGTGQYAGPGGEEVTIEFDDGSPGYFGSMWKIGPSEAITVPRDCADQFRAHGRYGVTANFYDHLNPNHPPHQYFLVFQPNVFATDGSWELFDPEGHVSAPCNCSRGAADAAASHRTPAVFTLTDLPHNGGTIIHMIEGDARVTVTSGTFVVPAGTSALMKHGRVIPVATWPVAAQKFVPSFAKPPGVTAVKTSVPKNGRTVSVSFRLDRPASLLAKLLRGKRVVLSKSFTGRRGKRTLTFSRKHLGHGRYQLELIATASHRVTISYVKLKL